MTLFALSAGAGEGGEKGAPIKGIFICTCENSFAYETQGQIHGLSCGKGSHCSSKFPFRGSLLALSMELRARIMLKSDRGCASDGETRVARVSCRRRYEFVSGVLHVERTRISLVDSGRSLVILVNGFLSDSE